MIKYSKDGRVCFNPKGHTYTIDGERTLMGVTTYIEQFKNKFDADYFASKKSQETGVPKDQILWEWKQKADHSRNMGTAVHQYFEEYFDTASIPNPINDKERAAMKFINDYFETGRLMPVEVESIVYSDTLASQRDLVARNEQGDYFVFDWKTNETISKNGYNKTMKGPYSHLPDATFYHYSLQLSLYEKMSLDYDIKDSFIVHIKNNDYEIIRSHKIDIPDEVLYI